MKLKLHDGQGTLAATGLAKVLSEDFSDLTLAVGPPRYYKSKKILMLPAIPAGELPRSARVQLLGFLAHEAWERRWGEWDPVDPRWWGPREEDQKVGLRSLVNALNDARVDRLGSEEYPGVGMYLKDMLGEDYAAMRRKHREGSLPLTMRNLAILVRHVAEDVVTLEQLIRDFASWEPWLEVVSRFVPFDLSSTDAVIEQALDLHAALSTEMPGTGSKPTRMKKDRAEETLHVPALAAEAEEDHDTEKETLHRIANNMLPGQRLEGAERFGDALPKVYSFDPSKDKVYCPSTKGAEILDAEAYRRAARALTVKLRQALSSNTPLPERRRTRGALDDRSLARLVTGERDVFLRHRPQEDLSTAVVLSWDESHTMTGERIEQVRFIVHALNTALGTLRIPTLLHGWTTHDNLLRNWNVYRQEPLRHRIYKGFEERWDDNKVLRRLAKIDTLGGTPTGEALLFGAEALKRRNEQRKLLFFLTDGEPQIASHGSEDVHHKFIQDVLEQSRVSGIEVVGVGIQADLSHLFEHWVRVDADLYRNTTNELVKTLRRMR